MTEDFIQSLVLVLAPIKTFLSPAYFQGEIGVVHAVSAFVAGFAVNLTPCVYPMIPVTIGVLNEFGGANLVQGFKEKRRKQIFSGALYTAGIVLSYTFLGLFAGYTGTLFGSLFQGPYFSLVIGCMLLLFGFSMAGAIDLSAIQNFATKIPVSRKYPSFGLITMGMVSGLIAAPCAGPVLGGILLMLSKIQSPVLGASIMLAYAMGFAFPYFFIALVSGKVRSLPRVPWLILGSKVVFSALLFGLAVYYLRPLILGLFGYEFFYLPPTNPGVVSAIVCLLVALALWKSGRFKKMAFSGLVISLSFGSLWLTLAATYSFERPDIVVEEGAVQIVWLQNLKDAEALASRSHKPVLLDVVTDWCIVCKKMDRKFWPKREIVEFVNKEFIAVRLNITDSFSSGEDPEQFKKWGLPAGVPALLFFRNGSTLTSPPASYFIGEPSLGELVAAGQKATGGDFNQ